jgi:DNA-binding transcriptional MerR regulator
MAIREVARLIGCSVWTVRQQCMRQGLPHFRLSRSGRLIFYRNQVVRWLIAKQNERRW